MLEKLSQEEHDFLDVLYDPIALSECLFHDFDNLMLFDEEHFGHVRLGQLPLLSYELTIDYEQPNLTDKENFKLREGAGNLYCFAARLFGKTLVSIKLDMLVSMLTLDGDEEGFTSDSSKRIRKIMETVFRAVESHPFYQMFKPRTNRSTYSLDLRNGWNIESVNMNVGGKAVGQGFHQKHFKKLYVEEASKETMPVYKARQHSVSEDGCVIRSSGMTDFTRHSPAGKAYNEFENQKWVLNLPQFANPKWDAKEKERAIRKYGGESNPSYRVYVLGEIVEEGVNVFDMERVRANYKDRPLKLYEIKKETYKRFTDNPYNEIFLVRPDNADSSLVAADIGESAPTEIIVLFRINNKYRWEYNIVLYNLTHTQQLKVFKYVVEQSRANHIGIDCGEGTGRAIKRELENVVSSKNLFEYRGAAKIRVDFEKDENNNVIYKKGEPLYREEYMSEWSIKNLQKLLYNKKLNLPYSYKFDSQFDAVIAMRSGERTKYDVKEGERHLLDSFRVFSILEWDRCMSLLKPVSVKRPAKRGIF